MFNVTLAAALSGVPVKQLNAWRRNGGNSIVFTPECCSGRDAAYSFRDVVTLRTVAYVGHLEHVGRIRSAFHAKGTQTVAALRESDIVVTGSLYVIRGSADRNVSETFRYRSMRRQVVLFDDILGPFTTLAGVCVPDLSSPYPHLEVNEGVLGGHPVIRGSRVPYEVVAELVADGVPLDRVCDYFPCASDVEAEEASAFADYVHTVSCA